MIHPIKKKNSYLSQCVLKKEFFFCILCIYDVDARRMPVIFLLNSYFSIIEFMSCELLWLTTLGKYYINLFVHVFSQFKKNLMVEFFHHQQQHRREQKVVSTTTKQKADVHDVYIYVIRLSPVFCLYFKWLLFGCWWYISRLFFMFIYLEGVEIR